MKYFLHDSTAFLDEKVTLLYLQFGFEAVGLFYVILEKLALQEQPVNEIVLKSQLNIKKRLQKQLNFMYKIGLLEVKNGNVFNINLLNFSGKYQIKKEKTRKRVSEWRDNQDDEKNVTCYKSVRNAPKDNISKVNKSKYIYKERFDFFFKAYYSKIKRPKEQEDAAFKEFEKLTEEEQQKALDNINLYADTKPENEHEYLVMCKNYLAGKLYNNEFKPKQTKESFRDEVMKEVERLNRK